MVASGEKRARVPVEECGVALSGRSAAHASQAPFAGGAVGQHLPKGKNPEAVSE
jgi:hypothetical protein